jgi:hypothetical protein
MAAWHESPNDEWRFDWLRLLLTRAREAVRPTRPRRRDLERPEQRDGARVR